MAINKNFVIKNGVEVNTSLIVGDATLNKVGVGTTVPGYTLHVGGSRGGIGATDITITGIATVGTSGSTSAALSVVGVSTFQGDIILLGSAGVSTISFDASLDKLNFADNARATFGTGNDLQIYHEGTYSYISNQSGDLRIDAKEGERGVVVTGGAPDSSVELYYDNTKTFNTTPQGINVVGVTTSLRLNVSGISTLDGGVVIGSATSIFANGNVAFAGLATANGGVQVGTAASIYTNGNIAAAGIVTANGGLAVGAAVTLASNGNAAFAGIVTTGGALIVGAGATISGDILPDADGSRDLGSSTLEFQDLFIDGTANIDTLVADTAAIGDLTNNRVVIAGTSGELEDDANFTYDGSSLNIGAGTGVTVFNNGNAAFSGIVTVSSDLRVGGNSATTASQTQSSTTFTSVSDDSLSLTTGTNADISMIGNHPAGPAYANAENKNPSVTWNFNVASLPAGVSVASYAVLLEDLRAADGNGDPLVHWSVSGIPANITTIPADAAASDITGATVNNNFNMTAFGQAVNTAGVSVVGYSGPQPATNENHIYRLSVTAQLTGDSTGTLTQGIEFRFNTTNSLTGAPTPTTAAADNLQFNYTTTTAGGGAIFSTGDASLVGVATIGQLHVTGIGTIDSDVRVGGASTFVEIARFEDDLAVGVSTFFVDKSTGRIGIGTNVPSAALQVGATAGTGIGVSIFENGNAAFSGIVTVGGNLKVTGDLEISEDLVLDTNLNLLGIASISNLDNTGAGIGSLSVTGVSTFSGDLIVGVSTFFVDKSTGRIGIGTNVPSAALQVGATAGTGIGVSIHENGNAGFTGIVTVGGVIDANGGINATTAKIEDLTNNRVIIAGTGGELEDSGNLTFDGSTLAVTGDETVSGKVSVGSGVTASANGNLAVAGISTFNGNVLVGSGVTIQPHGGVSIAGITTIGGSLNVTGNSYFVGMVTFAGGTNGNITLGDNAGDNVVFNADVNSNVIPNTTNTYDLGSASQQWKDIYVDGIGYIDTVSADGVGIATATIRDSAKLDVDGDARFSGKVAVKDGGNAGAGVTIFDNGNIVASGIITASSFVGSFSGTVTTATNVTVADESSDTECFPLFATAATGDLAPKSGSNLTFNSNTGALTATSFAGNLTGGTVSGTTGTFNGDVSFAGSTGAASTVLFDKSDNSLKFVDNAKAKFGSGDDLQIYHDGSKSLITDSGTGHLEVDTNDFRVQNAAANETILTGTENGSVDLYFDNSRKLQTTGAGVTVTGICSASGGFDIGIHSAGTSVATGPIKILNFVGTGNTFAYTAGTDTIDISIAGGGGGGGSETDTSVSSTSATSIYTTAHATNRSVSAIIQITQGSSYQVGRYLVIHDGTTATIVEESAVATGDMLGSFTADINSTNLRILVNMSSASSATVTILPTVVTV